MNTNRILKRTFRPHSLQHDVVKNGFFQQLKTAINKTSRSLAGKSTAKSPDSSLK
jgi:hypothetical protein